jgi:hypothetical protein
MRKTLGENIGGVENLFHDCSNNNFKNESNGKEGSSAHATDGGDCGKIILAGGEAKSESATINKTLMTINNMRIWVTVGDEKIFPEESDDESDDNDSVWAESEKKAPKKAKEAYESSNKRGKGQHYSDEEITLLMNLHSEGYQATAICKLFPGRSNKSIADKIRNTITKNTTIPVTKRVGSSIYWTNEDERKLLVWYEGLDITPPEVKLKKINFDSITRSLGRTKRACYDKLRTIISSGVLDQEEIDALFSCLPNYNYQQDVPQEMHLENFMHSSRTSDSFMMRLVNNEWAFHITQIPPSKMAVLDRERFLQMNPSLILSQVQDDLMSELDGTRCLLPDKYVRLVPYNYDRNLGGVENPHIRNPATGVFRPLIHYNVYVLNDLIHALYKYRTAADRKKWYGQGQGQRSESCFLYLLQPEDVRRSGFVDTGLGFGESHGNECCGKSYIVVRYSGCYQVFWNGSGFRNATFSFTHI